MAAITTRLLNLRPILRLNSHSLRHFSSSSDPDPEPEPESEPTAQNQTLTQSSSLSSYLNDVKASLQREPQQQNRLRRPQSFPGASQSPSKVGSLDEIRRNLSEYRVRSAAPPPASGQFISFQELYKRNVISKSDESAATSPSGKAPSFDSIRDSLSKMQKNQIGFGGKGGLKVKSNQEDKPLVVGGSDGDGLPSFIFGEERKGTEAGGMRTELFKSYTHSELGKRLQTLRPQKKRNWFSLQELNDRLVRLREIEEKESRGRSGDSTFKHLRESLAKLKSSDDEKNRERMLQRLDVLEKLGGTPSFMLSPPKEHLVEKYFHPDNMSSAEKLKLELKKVRDEFKMSESDCGSARVQVAQLTTKIKHLSTVLQKKDKHSRKGLQAMVQRRKKLLKYLRRTDWDSYSLLLSKLGLRDNPDVKA